MPTLEAAGQPDPKAESERSRASSASEQPTSPSASEGLSVIPRGSATTVFSMSEAASASGSGLAMPGSGTSREKSRPEAAEAAAVVARAPIEGEKGSREQATIPWGSSARPTSPRAQAGSARSGSPSASRAPGWGQESAA